jgi:hypothetical protein
MRALILAAMVAGGCGGNANGQVEVAGPPADRLETAFSTAWESIGGMERESRPHITWVESVDCDSLASAETATGDVGDHFCNGAWIDSAGNAVLPWTGRISHDPGFPAALSAYRNWLRYSSFKTHTEEQAAFDQSFVEGLTSIDL